MAGALEAGSPARPGIAVPPVWAVTALWGAVHLVLAALVPLFQDEAYYALWATRPVLVYYDHPPMIAWWIWVGEALAGHGPLGVRLLPVLAQTAAIPLTAQLARRLSGSAATGRLAAVIYAAMLLPIALGFTATPDAPSVFFWVLSCVALVEARTAGGRRATGWFLLAGLALGLGMLSKFTNIFLCVGLLAWLVATREGRTMLRRPAPWAGAALTLAVIAPYLAWNASHGWYGFARQFSRLEPVPHAHLALAGFFGIVLVAVTPPLLWLAGRGMVRAVRGGPAAARIQLWLNAPFPLYLLYHATHAVVQANWIAPLFPGLAMFAALGTRQRWRAAAAFSAGLAALALVLALWPGSPVFRGDNPPNQTKGWAALAATVRARAEATGARWIATRDYGTTGEIAFLIRDLPVRAVEQRYRYAFLGPIPADLCDAPALLVQPAADHSPPPFAEVGDAEIVVRRSAGVEIRRYELRRVQGMQGCQ